MDVQVHVKGVWIMLHSAYYHNLDNEIFSSNLFCQSDPFNRPH